MQHLAAVLQGTGDDAAVIWWRPTHGAGEDVLLDAAILSDRHIDHRRARDQPIVEPLVIPF